MAMSMRFPLFNLSDDEINVHLFSTIFDVLTGAKKNKIIITTEVYQELHS